MIAGSLSGLVTNVVLAKSNDKDLNIIACCERGAVGKRFPTISYATDYDGYSEGVWPQFEEIPDGALGNIHYYLDVDITDCGDDLAEQVFIWIIYP